jgi:membrane protein
VDVVVDYLRRVARGLVDGNVFFLASGLAFSILLALVPFLLLLITGASLLLGDAPDVAAQRIVTMVVALLPPDAGDAALLLREMVGDILRTRRAVGLGAAIGFVWTSTRLFGAMRTVLAMVLDHEDRSIVRGKLFDVVASGAALAFVVVYLVVVTWVGVVSDRGASLLGRVGVAVEPGGVAAWLGGRLLAMTVLAVGCYLLFRWLPRARPAPASAAAAAVCTAGLFEIARHLFGFALTRIGLASLYAGTIAVVVSVVFWTYYAALLFVVGAQVAAASELRREELRRLADPALPDPSS